MLLEGGAVGDQLDDQASPWLLLGPRTSSPILPDPSASSELSGADEDRDAEERRWYNQAEADSSAQSITVPKESQWSLISQNRDLQRTQDHLSVSAEGYRNALAAAFHSIPAKPPLSLPWEDGVWVRFLVPAARESG